MVSKKRYIGLRFDSPHQTKGVIDCKGLEAVRRDSCPLVQETMLEAVTLFFETRDLSKLRIYLENVFKKVYSGTLPLTKYVFSKQVKFGNYRGTLPPAAIVANKQALRDPRAAPVYSERVSFIVATASSSSRLIDRVVSDKPLSILLGCCILNICI